MAVQPAANVENVPVSLRPDLIVTISHATAERFRAKDMEVLTIPCGIDTARFRRSTQTKAALRRRHGLPLHDELLLHVGHLKAGRGVEHLQALSGRGRHMLLVASPETKPDANVLARIPDVEVRRRYIEDLPGLYSAADAYVFPTEDPQHCIELPLSVLEARSCGTPVVTTPFGALPEILGTDPGTTIVPSGEIGQAVAACLKRPTPPAADLTQLSWLNAANVLIDYVRGSPR